MAISRKELLKELLPGINALFGIAYDRFKKFGQEDNVDNHNYKTVAKDLPIEICRNIWIVKFGNEPVPMVETMEQEPFMWEVGNRLYWAHLLEYDETKQTYTCR